MTTPLTGEELRSRAYAAAHQAADILEDSFDTITIDKSIMLTNLSRKLACAATEIQSRKSGNQPKHVTH